LIKPQAEAASKVRIVLIGPAYPLRGGIAQYNTSLARAFAAAGDQVLVISYARQYPRLFFPGTTQEDLGGESFGIEAEHLVDSINPLNWPKVARRIAGFKPDLVVVQWWQPFFGPAVRGIVRNLKASHQVPVVLLCHNLLSHEKYSFPFRGILERQLAKTGFSWVDGFLVHAEKLAGELKSLTPGRPIAKILHPLYDFYNEWDKPVEDRGDSDQLEILFFGKIRRYKGLDVLIDALGMLGPEIQFHARLAGECYLPLQDFRKKISELGLERKVTWMNRYIPNQEIPQLFRSADVVVLPYLSASQSGVIPVAYQFEVPVIVSDVGGLSEVVREGKTGFLVPPGNPGKLAEAITRFYNLESRSGLRQEIRDFRKRFTWESVVNEIRRLYLRIVESAKQGE